MSSSIILFSNLIFHSVETIRIPKKFNNFSSCEILIFQMVELIFLFYKLLNFTELLIIENYQILYY